MHLWLSEGSRPFALVLFPSPHGYLESKLNELFWPDRSSQGFAFSSRKLDFYNSTSITNFIRYDDIIFSLFDNDYRLLYITLRSCAMRGNMSMCCLIFTGSLNDNGTVNFGYVGMSRVHANNNKRHWSEDPYEKKFYYTFESQGIIRLYSVPFSKILLVMADGTSGKLEMSFKVGIEYFSVSRNVVISHRNDAGKILHFIQDLNSTKSKGIICEEETSASSLHDRFLLTVIFDKDYCVLDDGLNSSFNCSSVETVTTLMMPEVILSLQLSYYSRNIFVKTRLFIDVQSLRRYILFIIILGVQLWRSRRETADKTFLKAESPRIHYYPTFVKDGSPDF
uniref:LAM_G_DOMAIN domain-containing protein n=1 Tax=Syphacia muris TaxID=451379 RepID=A0A0N5AK94_9BILA